MGGLSRKGSGLAVLEPIPGAGFARAVGEFVCSRPSPSSFPPPSDKVNAATAHIQSGLVRAAVVLAAGLLLAVCCGVQFEKLDEESFAALR